MQKGDKISLIDQYVPDADEIDDTMGAKSDPFANHKPNIQMPQKAPKPSGPAGTPDDPYRFVPAFCQYKHSMSARKNTSVKHFTQYEYTQEHGSETLRSSLILMYACARDTAGGSVGPWRLLQSPDKLSVSLVSKPLSSAISGRVGAIPGLCSLPLE